MTRHENDIPPDQQDTGRQPTQTQEWNVEEALYLIDKMEQNQKERHDRILNKIEEETANTQTDTAAENNRQEVPTHEIVVEEVNKRIVAPLLFGFGTLLLFATIGALFNGAFLLSIILAPIPIITAWYMWKARETWA